MARRKNSLLDELATAPWPVGIVAGLIGFGVLGYGAPAWLSSGSSLFGQMFANGNPFWPLAWLVLAVCWLAAGFSFAASRRRRCLLDTRSGLDSIAALGWRDFERLVGEAFRRQGYHVEETGLGGADGGIDLVLAQAGRRILVQCKQWRHEKVPVSVVREMYGLLVHHNADEVRIAALGGFTADAAQFVRGKPIQLIEGHQLLEMIRSVQRNPINATAARAQPRPHDEPPGVREDVPACPRCQAPMVRRTNRRDGTAFWGCPQFPSCRGTR